MSNNINMNMNSIANNTSDYSVNSQYNGRSLEHQPEGDNNHKLPEEAFINAIEKANHITSGTAECQFSVHKDTKQIMLKLVDSTTKEVIREIPAEKILDMVANMCKLAGVFVDEKR